MASLNTTNTQDQKKRHQCTSSPWCRHCLPCFSKLNINKTLTFPPVWLESFVAVGRCISCFRTLFTWILSTCLCITTMPFCSHSVISCFACWHNWTDSCLDSTEPHYVYNILQDMNGAVAPLYAPILALWCSCLYIYTVWLVYCAIVLHVWNKAEWAWPTWKWVCHF